MGYEIWTIDEGDLSKWEDLLNSASLTKDYVHEMLERYAHVELTYGKPEKPSQLGKMVERADIAEELLFQSEHLEIYSARNPRTLHHLWVTLRRPIKEFTEILPSEAYLLRVYVGRALEILDVHFGLPSSVIAQWMRPQIGHPQDRYVIEILPPLYGYSEALNLLDKIDTNNHVHFRGKFDYLCPLPSSKEVKEHNKLWKKALSLPHKMRLIRSDRPYSWTQIQVEKIRAIDGLLNFLEQMMLEADISLERVSISDPRLAEPIMRRAEFCPFCKKEISEGQSLHEGKHVRVLYNYKPSRLGGNFLLIPKRHIESSSRLTREEIEEMHLLSVKLSQALKIEMNEPEIDMYIQDGPSVGQTVRHSHMHVVARPHPLKYLFFSMNYEGERHYTKEEIMPYIEPVVSRFKQLIGN